MLTGGFSVLERKLAQLHHQADYVDTLGEYWATWSSLCEALVARQRNSRPSSCPNPVTASIQCHQTTIKTTTITKGFVMPSRRQFIGITGASALAAAAPTRLQAEAARSNNDSQTQGYRPVRTLNGWTLPYTLKDGVKEFHLRAEEIDHEFAPGTQAKCWGYNGSTPGPTIEVVEGDQVRILVTNALPEHTTIHWHGIILPSGMDGVGGLSQPQIRPGETYAYEFEVQQHGTHMYHPHADEMTQIAVGLMGMLVIHPKQPEAKPADRDYCFMLHNWAVHPGTYRPDPSVLVDFDLWTFNSKVFPAIDPLWPARASGCGCVLPTYPCGTIQSICMAPNIK
ncbi:MAG: hypothetical protein CM15mP120_14660 [Pseudomonadota bacterium]|nr:MAG: hypothetical protein CM15mP120_14660 [Pseudomonadota bacterium]